MDVIQTLSQTQWLKMNKFVILQICRLKVCPGFLWAKIKEGCVPSLRLRGLPTARRCLLPLPSNPAIAAQHL